MNKINICLIGAAGRLGSCVLKALMQSKYSQEYNLVGAIVSKKSAYLNKSVKKIADLDLDTDLLFSDNVEKYLSQLDLILDCSSPESSMHSLQLAKAANKKIILCATGFTSDQQAIIRQTAQFIPIVFAPNTSIGLNLTNAIAKFLTEKTSEKVDIQILETHHVHKKDAPSGAAKLLAETIYQATDKMPTIDSMRVGEVVGEHTLLFTLQGEQIQITHKAMDRSIFALGALRAAKWLSQVSQPEFYTMADVLRLNTK